MWRLLSFRLFSMVRPLQTADASGRRTYKIAGIFKEDDLQGIRRFQGYAETLFEVGLQVDDRHIWWFHSNHEMWIQNKYSVEYSLDDLMECTALVCYNDMLAEEIYHDLSQKESAFRKTCQL